MDDTGTMLDGMLRMQWRQIAPSRKTDNMMEGITQIRVRLNLAPWTGRTGRLYMTLPEQAIGPIHASWPAHGRFQAGDLISGAGQRALLYAGPISSPVMEELLLLKLEVDGMRLNGIQRVNFNFEIDTD